MAIVAIAAAVATAVFLGNPNSIKSVLLISRGREKFNRLIIPESDADYQTRLLPDSSKTLEAIKDTK